MKQGVVTLLLAAGAILGAATGYRLYLRLTYVPPLITDYGQEQAKGAHGWYNKSLSDDQRQHLLDGQFEIINSTNAMPDRLKEAFRVVTREPKFALANPEEKYQETDVIREPGLPFRRLIFAGVSDNKWFVHYEHGGIGKSYDVVILQHDPNQGRVRFEWAGSVGRAKDLQDLRQLIYFDKPCGEGGYYW